MFYVADCKDLILITWRIFKLILVNSFGSIHLVHTQNFEMLVFWEILRMYYMDDPFRYCKHLTAIVLNATEIECISI